MQVTDIQRAAEILGKAGFRTSPPARGSRLQPSGATLAWTTADIAEPEMPLAPFLIAWSEASPHPSTTTPPGCTLESLELHDPNPEPLARLVAAMDVEVGVRESQARRMVFAFQCPAGRVSFAGNLP